MGDSATSSTAQQARIDALMAEASSEAVLRRVLQFIALFLLVALIVVTYRETEFAPGQLFDGIHNMGRVLAGFLHPDWSLMKPGGAGFPEGLVPHYALQTLAIAILGTALGAVVAIPLSFVAAGNLMRRNALGSAVYFVVRTLMSMIRAIPTIFWGILFVTSVGLGPFPGVLAVMIFSVGLMSKLFSEAIEAIDSGQVEALTATGANPIQVLVNGVGPQVLPYLVAHLLYSFEVNVHSATILGLIGAGGIGFLFSQYIEQFLYRQEAMVLIVVVLMTMLIDYTSATIRRRII
jgi:phosphonate transport system permease protein